MLKHIFFFAFFTFLGCSLYAEVKPKPKPKPHNESSATNKCKTAAEKKCLADTINGEARNQGLEGMIIVAKAVMTRYARGYNGKTICKITDGASFHRDARRPTKGGPVDLIANKNVKAATEMGCKMGDMKITHFYKKGTPKPKWAYKFPRANPPQLGSHYLYNAPMYVKADSYIDLDIDKSILPDFDFADFIPFLSEKESSISL